MPFRTLKQFATFKTSVFQGVLSHSRANKYAYVSVKLILLNNFLKMVCTATY